MRNASAAICAAFLVLGAVGSGQVPEVPATIEILAEAGIEMRVSVGSLSEPMTYFSCRIEHSDPYAESIVLHVQERQGGRHRLSVRTHTEIHKLTDARETFIAEMDIPSDSLERYYLRIVLSRGRDRNAYSISFAQLLESALKNEKNPKHRIP